MILSRLRASLGLAVSLALASGQLLANPGMGGMGGEDHHHSDPAPRPAPAPPPPEGGGCGGGCGGDSDYMSPNQAREGAAAAASAAMGGGTNITTGSGGRRSQDATGSIAELGAAEQTNPPPGGYPVGTWGPAQRQPDGSTVEPMPDGSTRTTRPDGSWFRTPPPKPPPEIYDPGGAIGAGGATGGGDAM